MTSNLQQHARHEKTLKPPMSRIPFSTSSWIDARLPELLWANLLVAILGRERGLSCIRGMAILGRDSDQPLEEGP